MRANFFLVIAFLCCAPVALANDFIESSYPDIDFKKKASNESGELILSEGKTYFLEVQRVVDGYVEYEVVEKMRSPNRTIIFRFEHDIMFGTIFTAVSPFKKHLDYTIRIKGTYTQFTDTIVLPMVQGVYQKKWPGEFIGQMLISNLKLRG